MRGIVQWTLDAYFCIKMQCDIRHKYYFFKISVIKEFYDKISMKSYISYSLRILVWNADLPAGKNALTDRLEIALAVIIFLL